MCCVGQAQERVVRCSRRVPRGLASSLEPHKASPLAGALEGARVSQHEVTGAGPPEAAVEDTATFGSHS